MAKIGEANVNKQVLIERTGRRGNHRFATLWVMQCEADDCGERYGANSCDFHIRRCPVCQNGKPGLSII